MQLSALSVHRRGRSLAHRRNRLRSRLQRDPRRSHTDALGRAATSPVAAHRRATRMRHHHCSSRSPATFLESCPRQIRNRRSRESSSPDPPQIPERRVRDSSPVSRDDRQSALRPARSAQSRSRSSSVRSAMPTSRRYPLSSHHCRKWRSYPVSSARCHSSIENSAGAVRSALQRNLTAGPNRSPEGNQRLQSSSAPSVRSRSSASALSSARVRHSSPRRSPLCTDYRAAEIPAVRRCSATWPALPREDTQADSPGNDAPCGRFLPPSAGHAPPGPLPIQDS